jgi:hypothetical protein
MGPGRDVFFFVGWMVPVSFHQNGVGLRLCVTTHPTTPRDYTMLFRVTNSGKKYDVTLTLALSLISNSGKNIRCNTRLR